LDGTKRDYFIACGAGPTANGFTHQALTSTVCFAPVLVLEGQAERHVSRVFERRTTRSTSITW
jgi:hypothetical protein